MSDFVSGVIVGGVAVLVVEFVKSIVRELRQDDGRARDYWGQILGRCAMCGYTQVHPKSNGSVLDFECVCGNAWNEPPVQRARS